MMNSPSDEFNELMERIRAGCPQAAQEMYDRYSHHIRRIVRRRLNQRLRDWFDSVDILQSVWASFFHASPQNYTFLSPEALIGFLARITHNKVIEEHRHHFDTQRYRITNELPAAARGQISLDALCRPDPTPSQEAIAREHWERLNQGQNPKERRILEMLRQGHSQREIAALLGVDRKTIQRLLQRLSNSLEQP